MNARLISRTLTFAAALALPFGLNAEETATALKFSDPSRPGTLRIAVARGEIHVEGADTTEVVVKSEAQRQGSRTRKDGLRVLTESASFSLSEKDNVITLDGSADGWMSAPSDFNITVPRNTNVVITNATGGDIACAGVSGDLEIKSLHGEVRLKDLMGGAVVDTMNGEISATIKQVQPGKALSFTSMNGEVIVKVPADTKANVRLRTQNGSILTDFDEKALVTKIESVSGQRRRQGGRDVLPPEVREAVREAARAGAAAAKEAAAALREAAQAAREGAGHEDGDATPPVAPRPPVPPSIPTLSGGKLVSGALNGGGTEIAIATMNGDVTLRQLEKE